MKLTNYFLPTLKEDPSHAETISHKLMLRAGMIRQQNAGIYIWLPLGLKVLKKIENVVREELNNAGCIELLMPCIQPASLWKESNRYDSYGREMLRIIDRHENDLLFGPTNEEVITDIVRNNIQSYREFPKILYQIQWKFRDEIRPRFGIMRGREFYMQDAYSFDIDEQSAQESYDLMFYNYIKIFKRLGLRCIPVRADTGAIGGDLSHEFHIIANTGESNIYYDSQIDEEIDKLNPDIAKIKTLYAMADDMHKSEINIPNLKSHKSIEVGHIFYYGTKYSESLKANFTDDTGKKCHSYSGCYGIGVSRLVAALIESSHDEKGIIWNKEVTPFQVSLINLNAQHEECIKIANYLYHALITQKFDALYDDIKASIGSKLSTHELLGIPIQIIVGPKLIKENKVELRYRASKFIKEVNYLEAVDVIYEYYK